MICSNSRNFRTKKESIWKITYEKPPKIRTNLNNNLKNQLQIQKQKQIANNGIKPIIHC